MDDINTFRYSRSKLDETHTKTLNGHVKTQGSEFDELLLNQWTSAMQQGMFRYTLEHVQTRVIPGNKQFIAQFNDKRTTKRRKPSPITNIKQPFNPDTFNFTKIQPGEILFKICADKDDISTRESENLVIINDSPVDIGHVLLVPRSNQGLPQVLTEDALRIAIDMMLLSNHRGFRVCWNSLGALASVNHLHFHAFYLDYPLLGERIVGEFKQAVSEAVLCNKTARPLTSHGCFEITEESTRGFVFQLHKLTMDSLTKLVFKVSSYLIDRQVPHNICITRGNILSPNTNCSLPEDIGKHQNESTIRVYLWPKKAVFGTKPGTPGDMEDPPFLNACIEPAGFLVIKDRASYSSLTEQEANALLGKYSLEEREFNCLKDDLKRFLETT